jgi:ribosome-binding factor A
VRLSSGFSWGPAGRNGKETVNERIMGRYRKEKIASVVRECVSDAIARKISDPRLAPLTTVSRVEVHADVSIVTVFVTVPGGEATERRTLKALQHAGGYLQRFVAKALELRQCPELRIEIDVGARLTREMMQLLADNRREYEAREASSSDDGVGSEGQNGDDADRFGDVSERKADQEEDE